MYIINSFISNIQLSKININRRGKDVMLTFDCGHSALCRVLYVKLLNSSTMFFKSKKLFF